MNDYEVYNNPIEAIDTWLEHIALENTYNTTDIDFSLGVNGISDIIMFNPDQLKDVVSTEAMTDTLKTMASVAYSKLKQWFKKFIDFFFGWALKFIKGSMGVRDTIRKSYQKAKKYLKKMNEMISKIHNAGTDKEVTIGENAGVNATKCLITMLLGSYMLGYIATDKDIIGDSNAKVNEERDSNKNIETKDREGKFALVYTLGTLFSIAGTGLVTAKALSLIGLKDKSEDFREAYRENGFDMKKFAETELFSKNKDYKDGIDKLTDGIKGNLGEMDKKNDETDNDVYKTRVNKFYDDFMQHIRPEYDKAKEELKAFIEENDDLGKIDDSTKGVEDAFNELRLALQNFVKICDSSKDLWNFEKNARLLEKKRRELEKSALKLDNLVSDDFSKKLIELITTVGGIFNAVTNGMSKVASMTTTCINRIILDVEKMGAMLIKII